MKHFCLLTAFVIFLKLSLVFFTHIHHPGGKFLHDSERYLQNARCLAEYQQFCHFYDGKIVPEFYRTPGYPVFLAVAHHWLALPLWAVLLIQQFLTVAAAWLIYRAAGMLFSAPVPVLAGLIVLADPPSTLYSLTLLTEPLLLVCVSIFLFSFTRFMKEGRGRDLAVAAVVLAASVYVKPVMYYFAVIPFIFLLGQKRFQSASLFLLIVCALIAPWHFRNKAVKGNPGFSSIANATVNKEGLWKSYGRGTDEKSVKLRGLPPAAYYLNVASRNLLALYTEPANFKYFQMPALKAAGKVFSYPWIVFWMTGLLVGISRMKRRDTMLIFCCFMLAYFTAITIIGTMWGAGARFRIPMVPAIALISSFGWSVLLNRK